MTPPSTAENARALWLTTLQTLFGRASHDVKDALNGVSVNLEVIRSRAMRPDAAPKAVAPFAEAAGQQLERLTTLLEATLAVGRVERTPVDVSMTLRQIATLCGAASSADDAPVAVPAGVEGATTGLAGDVVRLALAAALLHLVASTKGGPPASPVRCTLRPNATGVVVTMQATGRRAMMPEAVSPTLRAAGVRWTEDELGNGELSLVFPRA
jgi:hypothetical protein